jgi:hypothetical protein
MDETEELIRLCGRALVAQVGDVPGVELHMTRNCVLGLTGEPSADFNMLTLGPDPDAEAFLIRSVARAKERGMQASASRKSPTLPPGCWEVQPRSRARDRICSRRRGVRDPLWVGSRC